MIRTCATDGCNRPTKHKYCGAECRRRAYRKGTKECARKGCYKRTVRVYCGEACRTEDRKERARQAYQESIDMEARIAEYYDKGHRVRRITRVVTKETWTDEQVADYLRSLGYVVVDENKWTSLRPAHCGPDTVSVDDLIKYMPQWGRPEGIDEFLQARRARK